MRRRAVRWCAGEAVQRGFAATCRANSLHKQASGLRHPEADLTPPSHPCTHSLRQRHVRHGHAAVRQCRGLCSQVGTQACLVQQHEATAPSSWRRQAMTPAAVALWQLPRAWRRALALQRVPEKHGL